MNLNLATPYGDTPSPPQNAFLTFYSHQTADMMFPVGKGALPAKLEIFCQAGLRSLGLRWSLHHNMVQTPFLQGEAEQEPSNLFRINIPTAKLRPGFYDLRVVLDSGQPAREAKTTRGVCVFGWKPANMPLRETRPANFREFWDKAKANLDQIPLDFKHETPFQTFDREQINAYNLSSAALPAAYDPTGHKAEVVESCKVSFAGPDGGRVYGWLAKPVGPGPFPAMLVLPGAGFNARPRPLEHARHGYVALDMQVHGQDVDLKEYPRLPGYQLDDARWDAPENYYYYNVHLRVAQAINFLASRPDVDARKIVLVGGSQGGRLAIVGAALDKRVAAVVATIANSPNFPELNWVARMNGLDKVGDNPNLARFKDRPKFDGQDLQGAPPAVDSDQGRTFAYYDPMNYAPDVKCPVLMAAGLIDPVSPPTSIWAVHNRLATWEKMIVPLPGLAHDWSAEFDRRAWRWLDKKLGG